MAGVRALRVIRKTAAYSALVNDCVLVDATAGAVTITLPRAYLGHESIVVKKVDSSANAVTVQRTSPDTIDGANTYVLSAQYAFVEVVPETGAWHVVAATGAAAAATVYPWLVDIDPMMTPIASVGTWVTAVRAYTEGGILDNTTGTMLNSEACWDVVLGAGTWTLELKWQSAVDSGIATFALDDGAGSFTDIGTIDLYNGGATGGDVRSSITGVAVASSIKRRLRMKMATKHASSSNYAARVQHIQLRRTA